MELLHLGLIIIGVIVLIVYNLYYKKINIKEPFSMVQSTDLEKKYLKKQDKYWDNRLFPQVVKGGNDDIKFLKFNREKTDLKGDKPTARILSPEISKKIERCKIIDKTQECSNIGAYECGYCWETDKIIYGDANGPIADVCSKKGVGWVPPGPRTNYYCQKKKDRALCGQMKDCGDSTGKKSICAWCPIKGKGVPKKLGPQGGWVAKYPEDKCDWKEKLLGEYGWVGLVKIQKRNFLVNYQIARGMIATGLTIVVLNMAKRGEAVGRLYVMLGKIIIGIRVWGDSMLVVYVVAVQKELIFQII